MNQFCSQSRRMVQTISMVNLRSPVAWMPGYSELCSVTSGPEPMLLETGQKLVSLDSYWRKIALNLSGHGGGMASNSHRSRIFGWGRVRQQQEVAGAHDDMT